MAAHRIEVITNHLRGRAKPNLIAATDSVYTLNNSKLSKEQRDFYEKNGYLVIRKLISPEILETCRQRFVDICNGVHLKGNILIMKDIAHAKSGYTGEDLYFKFNDIFHDKIFSIYTENQELLDYVECFTGPNITGVHSMVLNKPPGSTRHPPHQDLYYFPFRPAERIVAVWTAMEPVFKENGCLYVIPGSHKGQLHVHGYPKDIINKSYHGIQDEDIIAPQDKRVYLPMEAGDTVFFHPVLVHGSGANQTKGFRKAISCHYAASDCHFIETKGTLQENIAKELIDMAKKKGYIIDYNMSFYYRSKNVRGERINM